MQVILLQIIIRHHATELTSYFRLQEQGIESLINNTVHIFRPKVTIPVWSCRIGSQIKLYSTPVHVYWTENVEQTESLIGKIINC